eukprot:SAG11_NODE_3109_length_2681_cov_3.164214_2_plen_58_part_00
MSIRNAVTELNASNACSVLLGSGFGGAAAGVAATDVAASAEVAGAAVGVVTISRRVT